MKLFRAPQTRAQRGIWMLEEAGVDYDLETVDIRGEKRKDSAVFLRVFGMLPETANIGTYADRCAARPALQYSQAMQPA